MLDNFAWPQTAVAYVPFSWDHALTIIRIAGPLEQAGIKVIKGSEAGKISLESIPLSDVVIIQRDFPRFWDVYSQIISTAREHGKPVIFDLDDLLFELPSGHPDRQSHYYSDALVPILHAVYEADLVTTSSELLLGYLSAFNQNTCLLPTYLDDRLWSFRKPAALTRFPVTIGYMGSVSHRTDIETIVPVLTKLLEKYGDSVQLKFWEVDPPESVRGHPRVEHIPVRMPSYLQFVEFFSRQECDIFIAPLADSLFNRCKSPIKFYEYSAFGSPGVFSNLDPYRAVISHGENGFLASTLEEWESCISRLIESPDLRLSMSERAQATVRDKYRLSANAGIWKQAYQGALLKKHKPVDGVYPQVLALKHIADQLFERQRFVESQLLQKEHHARLLAVQDQQKSKSIRALEAQLAAQEQSNQTLEQQLSVIQDSMSWKISKRLAAVAARLLPGKSRHQRRSQKGMQAKNDS